MRNNYNKKKITFISKFKLIKYLFIFLTFILASFYFYDYILEKKIHREIIQEFSKKNNFVLASYETNELIRVDQSEVSKIINKYYDKSIFLIPLRNLSNQIRELNWVKDVNLSNNFKSKIFVEILEYEPLGLFFFNDKIYYFSKEGKVIDQFKENDENFIIFSGKNTLKHAVNLLDVIDSLQSPQLNNIREAHFINDRRWNLKFSNDLLLSLSEKNIESSLNGFIKLLNQLDESEILLIKSIDLRNDDKAIINFKKND